MKRESHRAKKKKTSSSTSIFALFHLNQLTEAPPRRTAGSRACSCQSRSASASARACAGRSPAAGRRWSGRRPELFFFQSEKEKASEAIEKKRKIEIDGCRRRRRQRRRALPLSRLHVPLLPAFYSPGAAASSPTAKSSVVSLEGAGGLDAISSSSTPLFLFEGVVIFFFFFSSSREIRGEEKREKE